MGQGELAGKIGYTNPNFVSMLEMGWSRVPLDKIGKIAEALHLPPHWFSERVLAARSNTDGDGFHKFLYAPGGACYDQYLADIEKAKADVQLDRDHHY